MKPVSSAQPLRSSLAAAIAVALAAGTAHASSVSDEPGLRAAIEGQQPVITLTANITLSSDLPGMDVNTTINGGGFTLDGDDWACLAIDEFDLVVSDLTISNCSTNTSGGGIYVRNGDLTVNNSLISNNSSKYDGGGIYVRDGDLTVSNSVISNNSSKYDGGGIFVEGGSLELIGTTVSGNQSTGNGGGIAVFSQDSEVSFQDSTISGNTAESIPDFSIQNVSTEDRGGFGPRPTGGGGAFVSASSFTMSNTTVTGNSALAPNSTAYGGGLFAYISGGTATISDSVISGNLAEGRPDEFYDYVQGPTDRRSSLFRDALARTSNNRSDDPELDESFGGGGFIVSTSSMTIEGTRIADNQAGLGGGGLLVIGEASLESSTVSGNQAPIGGGIASKYPSGDSLSVLDSTISGNSAFLGGGLFSFDPVELENSTLSGNQAILIGGALMPGGSSIRFSTIFGNSAGEAFGGIAALDSAFGDPQPLSTRGNGAASLSIFGSIIAGNQAETEPDLGVFSLIAAPGAGDMSRDDFSFDVEYSLIGVPPESGIFNVDDNSLIGVDPLLGPLANNGGPTFTHLLLPGSPAADLIPLDVCQLEADQRGQPRAAGQGCSAGSVEVSAQRGFADPVPVPFMSRTGLAITAATLFLLGLIGLGKRRRA